MDGIEQANRSYWYCYNVCAFATSGETRDSQSQMLSGLTHALLIQVRRLVKLHWYMEKTTFGKVVNFWQFTLWKEEVWKVAPWCKRCLCCLGWENSWCKGKSGIIRRGSLYVIFPYVVSPISLLMDGDLNNDLVIERECQTYSSMFLPLTAVCMWTHLIRMYLRWTLSQADVDLVTMHVSLGTAVVFIPLQCTHKYWRLRWWHCRLHLTRFRCKIVKGSFVFMSN